MPRSFVAWATTQMDAFRRVASETTRYGRLIDLQITLEGNHVYLGFEFTTGDASGQNMVTIATDAICRHIIASSPTPPRYHFVEANLSGDKKATTHSFMSVRGRKVTAEVRIAGELLTTAAPHDGGAADGLLADVSPGRRHERQHRRAGTLCQRPCGAVHRHRPGRGVRRRSGRGRDAIRADATMAASTRRSRCPT